MVQFNYVPQIGGGYGRTSMKETPSAAQPEKTVSETLRFKIYDLILPEDHFTKRGTPEAFLVSLKEPFSRISSEGCRVSSNGPSRV